MKTLYLIKEKRNKLIEAIQKNVSDIYGLNSGGCGVFAYLVGREFEKRGIPVKLTLINCNGHKDIPEFKNIINNYIKSGVSDWNLHETSFSHCCVTIGKTSFDSRGIGFDEIWDTIDEYYDNGSSYYKETGFYTVAEMKVVIKFGGWNPEYDTRQTPKMKKEIQEAFLKVLGK